MNKIDPQISFADVVHQQITFSRNQESQKLILELLDTPWVQRLRDISQTANTRLVYMFSEHSRFGHCLGVAYLAELLLERLEKAYPSKVKPYRSAVAAAALLHDLGHLAPGSHTAFKTWFPNKEDAHEDLACRIIAEDKTINSILRRYSSTLSERIQSIIKEESSVPAWTWQLISGGGWNVDRGNWTIVDSLMGGVSYGQYNVPALMNAIVLTEDGHLAVRENRLDAMMHFVVSRHAMYRQMYQHRVILACDTLNQAIVVRAREVFNEGNIFVDETMRTVLAAKSQEDLSDATVFAMRESWWRYHLQHWSTSKDPILADLAQRLRDRRLFKTVRLHKADEKQTLDKARTILRKLHLDEKYYMHIINTQDVHAGDEHQSMNVLLDDGTVVPLGKAEPLFETLTKNSKTSKKTWLALPAEAKYLLER